VVGTGLGTEMITVVGTVLGTSVTGMITTDGDPGMVTIDV
jgi:hypothetical protein